MKKPSNFSEKLHSIKDAEKSLYLVNDENNTFEHIINCLVAICDHNELQAEQCALIAHYNGVCEIAIDKHELLIPLQEDLVLYGLDVKII